MPEYDQSLEQIIEAINRLEPLIRKRDDEDFNSRKNCNTHKKIADLYRKQQRLEPSRDTGLKAIENFLEAIKFAKEKLDKSYLHLSLARAAEEVIRDMPDFIIAERGYMSALKASRMLKEEGHIDDHIEAEASAMHLATHLMDVSKDGVFYGYKAVEHSKRCFQFFYKRDKKRATFHSVNHAIILSELYGKTKKPVLVALAYTYNLKLYKSNPKKYFQKLKFALENVRKVSSATRDPIWGVKTLSILDQFRNHPKCEEYRKGKLTYIMGRTLDNIYENGGGQIWLIKAYKYLKEAVVMNENDPRYSLNSKYYTADVARRLFELTENPMWKDRATNWYNSVLSIDQENLERAYENIECNREKKIAKVHEKIAKAKFYLEELSAARAG